MNTFRVLLLAAVATLLAACSSAPSKPAAAPAAAKPAAAAAIPSIAGNWLMTIESQMGPQDSTLTVNQNGKDITGTLATPMGNQNWTGTFDGKDLKFGFNMSAQGMELRIDFLGVSDGQTMNGKATFGSFGDGTFKAKRQ